MDPNEGRKFSPRPFKELPDGALFVLLHDSDSKFHPNSDAWFRIYSDREKSEGRFIKIGAYGFRYDSLGEGVEEFEPTKLVLFGKCLAKASGKRYLRPQDELRGKILTEKPYGISFEELCRPVRIGRSQEKIQELRDLLSRLIEDSKTVRVVDELYILTGAGVRRAIEDGFSYGPVGSKKILRKGKAIS